MGFTTKVQMERGVSGDTSLFINFSQMAIHEATAQSVIQIVREEVAKAIQSDSELRKKLADAVSIAAKELPIEEIVKAVKESIAPLLKPETAHEGK